MMDRIVTAVDGYDYEQCMEDLGRMSERYPCLQVDTIGNSVMGKPIPAVRIGTGPLRIHYNASCHANEWITTPLLMTFLEDYAESTCGGMLLSERGGAELAGMSTLYAVPMVNPDGVNLVQRGISEHHPYYEQLLAWNGGHTDFSGWKSNMRGVDLNDQFPAHWEEERLRRNVPAPGPRDYPGTAPLTEPEAAALAEYARRHQFDLAIALHTQGREIYWNYRDCEPPKSLRIADYLAIQCGYRAVKLTDSDAGFKDWFIQEFRKPGFTVEVGYGVNPLPIDQFQAIYQEVLPIMEKGISALGELSEA